MPPETPKKPSDLWKDETYADWGDWLAGSLFKITCLLTVLCFAGLVIALLIGIAGAAIGLW